MIVVEAEGRNNNHVPHTNRERIITLVGGITSFRAD